VRYEKAVALVIRSGSDLILVFGGVFFSRRSTSLSNSHWLGVTERWHLSADNDWCIGRKSGCPRTINFASKELGEAVG